MPLTSRCILKEKIPPEGEVRREVLLVFCLAEESQFRKKKKKNETRKTQYQKVLPFVKVEVVVCMRLIKAKLSLLFCKVCV